MLGYNPTALQSPKACLLCKQGQLWQKYIPLIVPLFPSEHISPHINKPLLPYSYLLEHTMVTCQ